MLTCNFHFLVDRKGNYTSCFSACLSICLSVYLSIYISVVVETELEIGNVSRAHLPSDFFEIWFQGSQQYGLGPFQAILRNSTFRGWGRGSNRKFFVIFNELEFGKLCRQHISSDVMEIRFQGSQQYGLGPFLNNFANFTF